MKEPWAAIRIAVNVFLFLSKLYRTDNIKSAKLTAILEDLKKCVIHHALYNRIYKVREICTNTILSVLSPASLLDQYNEMLQLLVTINGNGGGRQNINFLDGWIKIVLKLLKSIYFLKIPLDNHYIEILHFVLEKHYLKLFTVFREVSQIYDQFIFPFFDAKKCDLPSKMVNRWLTILSYFTKNESVAVQTTHFKIIIPICLKWNKKDENNELIQKLIHSSIPEIQLSTLQFFTNEELQTICQINLEDDLVVNSYKLNYMVRNELQRYFNFLKIKFTQVNKPNLNQINLYNSYIQNVDDYKSLSDNFFKEDNDDGKNQELPQSLRVEVGKRLTKLLASASKTVEYYKLHLLLLRDNDIEVREVVDLNLNIDLTYKLVLENLVKDLNVSMSNKIEIIKNEFLFSKKQVLEGVKIAEETAKNNDVQDVEDPIFDSEIVYQDDISNRIGYLRDSLSKLIRETGRGYLQDDSQTKTWNSNLKDIPKECGSLINYLEQFNKTENQDLYDKIGIKPCEYEIYQMLQKPVFTLDSLLHRTKILEGLFEPVDKIDLEDEVNLMSIDE